MNTTRVSIENDKIKAFINALDDVDCKIISQEALSDWTTEVTVSYLYPHNLFYLGTIMSINMQLEKYNKGLNTTI